MPVLPPAPAWPTDEKTLLDYFTQVKITLRQHGWIGAATEQKMREIFDK
jgi:hypothetical protein